MTEHIKLKPENLHFQTTKKIQSSDVFKSIENTARTCADSGDKQVFNSGQKRNDLNTDESKGFQLLG